MLLSVSLHSSVCLINGFESVGASLFLFFFVEKNFNCLSICFVDAYFLFLGNGLMSVL